MFLNELDYNAICLFNDKMDEINGLGFSRWASEWKSRRNHTQAEGEESRPNKFNGPDPDALRSFVLTLRILTAPRDKCHIESIEKIYNKLPSDKTERQRFSYLKRQYDDFLSSDSGFGNDGISFTKKELIEHLIYGHLAHANPDKTKIVSKWLRYDDLANIYWAVFTIDLVKVYDFLLSFQELNRDLLKDHSLWLCPP